MAFIVNHTTKGSSKSDKVSLSDAMTNTLGVETENPTLDDGLNKVNDKVAAAQKTADDAKSAASTAQSAADTAKSAADSALAAANHFTYGTTDLTAGTSELETGKLYFVYE